MSEAARTRVGFIGLGAMARYHLSQMLDRADTEVTALCEPAPGAYAAAAELFQRRGLAVPPNEPDWERFVARQKALRTDAIFIITPHVLHFTQAAACLEAGLDVLLEKPMVMTADEALALIETRDRTGRLLVVAFQGSLSAEVREASRLLRSGELGPILNVNAMVWQNWETLTHGTWRQEPNVSGGGFLFDTGAHMLNTVADLAGEELSQVAAWLEDDGRPVDVRAVVMARLTSGALVTMNACGSAIPSCHSDIRVFTTEAILRTGVWGEALELQRAGTDRLRKVRSVVPIPIWEQFLNIRDGRIPNPSPPEAGLRMARLWDAIRASAARGGMVVTTPSPMAAIPGPAGADGDSLDGAFGPSRLGFEPAAG
jgi:predicted dehydrogenase